MSMVAKLNAAVAKAKAIETERDEALARITELETAATDSETAHTSAIEAVTVEHTDALTAMQVKLDASEGSLAPAAAKVIELEGQVTALTEERDGLKTKAELAHKALGDPQYVDAALKAFEGATADGGDVEANAGEKEGDEKSAEQEELDWLAAYDAAPDASTRRKMWKERNAAKTSE